MSEKIEMEAGGTPGFFQSWRGETAHDYEYNEKPYCDVTRMFDARWLDRHLQQATRWPMKWPGVIMWGQELQRQAEAHEGEEELVEEIKRIGSWIEYWGKQGFSIRKRQERDPRFVEGEQ